MSAEQLTRLDVERRGVVAVQARVAANEVDGVQRLHIRGEHPSLSGVVLLPEDTRKLRQAGTEMRCRAVGSAGPRSRRPPGCEARLARNTGRRP